MQELATAAADAASLPPPDMIVEPAVEAHAAEQTQAMDVQVGEAQPKAKVKPAFEDIDAVLKALADQDEVLKQMKQQIQDMITMNGALRKGIKQVVQDTSKNDDLVAELAATKKKLAVVKQYLG